jgi:hypothetical protein
MILTNPDRNYQLATPITGSATFASQCTSSLIPGATLAYLEFDGTEWQPTKSTVVASSGPTFVWGFHINGFNVQSDPTPLITTTSSIPTSSTSSLPTASSINNQETISPSKPISSAAIAGIVIGMVLLLAIGVAIGLWLLRRRMQSSQAELSSNELPQGTKNGEKPANVAESESMNKNHSTVAPAYELPVSQPHNVHEMSAEPTLR